MLPRPATIIIAVAIVTAIFIATTWVTIPVGQATALRVGVPLNEFGLRQWIQPAVLERINDHLESGNRLILNRAYDPATQRFVVVAGIMSPGGIIEVPPDWLVHAGADLLPTQSVTIFRYPKQQTTFIAGLQKPIYDWLNNDPK